MDLTAVLLKPLVSEKITMLHDNFHEVAFYVHPQANKLEIRQAVEKAFSVTVRDVHVVSRKPRAHKRQGRVVGRTPGWKKAYVKLAPDDKIEFFEGA